MRKIWIASVVFLLGAVACAWQGRDMVALILAGIGFELVYVADTRIDWKLRLTRKKWRQTLVEPRFPTTILASVAQLLVYVCMFFLFLISLR